MSKKTVLLAILDGFGKGKKDSSDAIYNANTPNLDSVFKNDNVIEEENIINDDKNNENTHDEVIDSG